MALDICAEALIRFFAESLAFMLRHWGWSLTFLIIGIVLQMIPYLSSALADGVDFILDFLKDLLPGFIGALLFTGISSIIMSSFWTIILLGSRVNIILKIIMAPFAFTAGGLLGFLFIPLPGLTFFYEFLVKNESPLINSIGAFFPIILVLAFGFIMQIITGQTFCDFVNEIIILIS